MTAAAAVMVARRRVAEHLLDVDATSPERAVTYQPARHLRRKGLRYLMRRGVVNLTQDGRYWIDEEKWREWRHDVRRRITIAMASVLAATAAVFALSR